MVDIRPTAGAPPAEQAHAAPNGAPPSAQQDNQLNINSQGGSGDMVHAGSPAPAPIPASALATYTGAPPMSNMPPLTCGGYYYGGGGTVSKPIHGMVWAPVPPPPPPHVNVHVFKSIQPNGADLPMNDMPTLRYFFNLGLDWMWTTYGLPPPQRHFLPRDVTQDMQQMSLLERGSNHSDQSHKQKPVDKPMQTQNKGNGQRTLLGPRFNKRGNQDGSQNHNNTQNKGYNNNNMPNKGSNRRNSQESRGQFEECGPEPPLVTVPYMYPPPVYPVHYYPVDSDPGMLSVMGGMGYINYEEGGEYMSPYYPHPPLYSAPPPTPLHIPPPSHHLQHHGEHK